MAESTLASFAPILVALATFAAAWPVLARLGVHQPHPLDRVAGQPESPRRGRVGALARRLVPPSLSHAHPLDRAATALRLQLAAAGNPLSLPRFTALTLGLSGGGALWMSMLAWRASLPVSPALATAATAAAFGAAAPFAWLYGRRQRRRQQIQRELPDYLDLLVVSVEAGLTFDAALSRITEHSHGQLTYEFRRTLAELELGVSRRNALLALVARTGSMGVAALVAAVLQAERTGMEIGPILRSQAERLRLQRRQRAAEAAMKAPVKMLFPLVLFIFPSVFVVILGPAVLTLVRTFGAR